MLAVPKCVGSELVLIELRPVYGRGIIIYVCLSAAFAVGLTGANFAVLRGELRLWMLVA